VPSLGDRERCEQDEVMLSFALRRRFAAGRIIGYAVRQLYGAESVIDEDLDADEVFAITGNLFPAVWCNITYDPAVIVESDWDGLVSVFGLQLYSSGYDKLTFPGTIPRDLGENGSNS
jgi:hypothetical protein